MSKAKTEEERHFYITLCVKESYSSRELERQINSGYYERYILSKKKILPESIKKLKENPFLDSYVIEFLNLPSGFKEADLRKGLIRNMRDFILEVGKDFTFIDEEFVEYAMSRTLSPMMVAEYQLQLPDKGVLQRKLQELINMPFVEPDE